MTQRRETLRRKPRILGIGSLNYGEIAARRWRFLAWGRTFEHRYGFRERGWRWEDSDRRRAWIHDGGRMPQDPEITWAARLRGVVVKAEEMAPARAPQADRMDWARK